METEVTAEENVMADADVLSDETVMECPPSALDIRDIGELPDEEQKALIGKLIEDAVYCDAWDLYFAYAKRNGVPLNEQVALEAVQAVGLDPCSVTLWMQAAECCETVEQRREVFQLGLTVPLFGIDTLYRNYTEFEAAQSSSPAIPEADCVYISGILKEEAWPDRFADLDSDTAWCSVRQSWMELLRVMEDELICEKINVDLQKRRMDLACRQMCVQLMDDEQCWYTYALFLVKHQEDLDAALETVNRGIAMCGADSFALTSLWSTLNHSANLDEAVEDPSLRCLLQQRIGAERIVGGDASKAQIKQLRALGKTAASEGLSDWKVFAQWAQAESSVLRDDKMAAKVFENCMVCCSSSSKDLALLGNKAIQFHLLHHHEREALGFAERQVEQVADSKHIGRQMAAWNALVQTEHALGSAFSKADTRREEKFPRCRTDLFLEKYSVGTFLPCDKATYDDLRQAADYAAEKEHEDRVHFHNVIPAANITLTPLPLPQQECEWPDETSWETFRPFASPHWEPATGNSDDVVGPRENRGRLVYRIQVDEATEARLRREQSLRAARRDADGALEKPDTPIAMLVHRVKKLRLSEGQNARLRKVSANWLLRFITSTELNLEAVLKQRANQRRKTE